MISQTDQQTQIFRTITDTITEFETIQDSLPFNLLRRISTLAGHRVNVKQLNSHITLRYQGVCHNCGQHIMLTVSKYPMHTTRHYDLFFEERRKVNFIIDETFIKNIEFAEAIHGRIIQVCNKLKAFL